MTDTLTAVIAQLCTATREYFNAAQANSADLETLIRKYLSPHFTKAQPTAADPTKPRLYRHPQRIGDIAMAEAMIRESHTERAGQIYMLAEILTALHRQAEAYEKLVEHQNQFADTYYAQDRKP